MSSNGRAMADITQAEWDYHRGELARVSGENGKMAIALQSNTDQMLRLTAAVDKLERGLRRADRRIESFEDLDEQAKMASLIADNKRLRGLPAKVAKWAGWGVATALGLEHLWRLFHP